MFIPKGYNAKEVVHKNVYDLLGIQSWLLFCEEALITLETIRELTGWMIVVNTWSFKTRKYDGRNGPFVNRGFRLLDSGVGSITGSHPRGEGFDLDAYDRTTGNRIAPDNVRKFILDNRSKFPHIKGLEVGINWVHFDTMIRNGYKKGMIRLFYPDGKTEWV